MTMGILFFASNVHLLYHHGALAGRGRAGRQESSEGSLWPLEDEIRVVSSDEFREDAGVSKKDLNPMHVNPAGGKKSEFTAAEFSVDIEQDPVNDRELARLRERFNQELKISSLPILAGVDERIPSVIVESSVSEEMAMGPTGGPFAPALASAVTAGISGTGPSIQHLGLAIVSPVDRLHRAAKVISTVPAHTAAPVDHIEDVEKVVTFSPASPQWSVYISMDIC